MQAAETAGPRRRRVGGAAVAIAAVTVAVATVVFAFSVSATAQQNPRDLSPAEARRLARDVLDKGPPATAPDLPELGDPPDFRLPEPPSGGAPGIGATGWVVLGVLGALVAIGLVWAVVAVVRDRRRDTDDDDVDQPDVTAGTRGRRRTKRGAADDFARRAHAAADAGDFATAIRLLHRAGLAQLDEDRVVRFRRGRTNGDYEGIVAAFDTAAAAALADVSGGAEGVQFGSRHADAADWQRALATWQALRAELAERAGADEIDRSRGDVEAPT